MTTAVVIATETARVSKHHDFEIKDAKGRTIGAFVTTWHRDYAPRTAEHSSYYPNADGMIKPGVRYRMVQVHASRNGTSYGASQSAQLFESDEAAAAYVAKYLEKAKKRALKAASK